MVGALGVFCFCSRSDVDAAAAAATVASRVTKRKDSSF